MAGPQNAIMGANSSPLDLPKADESVKTQDNADLQKAAAFTTTPEFEQLKQIITLKIEAWQQYLPGATGEILAGDRVSIRDIGNEERAYRWLAADYVITELRNLLSAYEQAAELLKDEATK